MLLSPHDKDVLKYKLIIFSTHPLQVCFILIHLTNLWNLKKKSKVDKISDITSSSHQSGCVFIQKATRRKRFAKLTKHSYRTVPFRHIHEALPKALWPLQSLDQSSGDIKFNYKWLNCDQSKCFKFKTLFKTIEFICLLIKIWA